MKKRNISPLLLPNKNIEESNKLTKPWQKTKSMIDKATKKLN
jgi:hypothetical protein